MVNNIFKLLSFSLLLFAISICNSSSAFAAKDSRGTDIQKEQLLRLERLVTTYVGQTKTNQINQLSYVEFKSSTKLLESPGTKAAGKSVKKGTRAKIEDDLRYIKGKIYWKVNISDTQTGWVDEKKLKRIPSTILMIDFDLDGVNDTEVRFIGEYSTGYFAFKNEAGDAIVKYFESKKAATAAGYTIIGSTGK